MENHGKEATSSLKPEKLAAARIERAWMSYRNRLIMRLLKNTIRSMENCMTNDIIKRLLPTESTILNDPSLQPVIRFRFGGNYFPPLVYFKVFYTSNASKVQYVSGQRILDNRHAAGEALQQQGSRIFVETLIADEFNAHGKVTKEENCYTIKDYMGMCSYYDNLPARNGGKANHWRPLNTFDLPQNWLFTDLMDYCYFNKSLETLSNLMKVRNELLRPATSADDLLHHYSLLTSHRKDYAKLYTVVMSNEKKKSGRKSMKEKKSRVNRMRRMYMQHLSAKSDEEDDSGDEGLLAAAGVDANEAHELYKWSQHLTDPDFLI